MTRAPSSSALLPLLLALVSIACTVGSALPGSYYLTSDPPLAPYRLSIREDDVGVDDVSGPHRRTATFEAGQEVVLDWSTLPLPQQKWIEVNGQDCEGRFDIQARVQTDLLLILTDDVCRIEVLGLHPEGAPHHTPGE